MQIGNWIVIGSNGIWFSDTDKTYTFKTKKEALVDVRYGVRDIRARAKVRRFACGEYIYTPKIAGRKEELFFKIVKVTEYNKEHYRKWIEEQEARKENLCLW